MKQYNVTAPCELYEIDVERYPQAIQKTQYPLTLTGEPQLGVNTKDERAHWTFPHNVFWYFKCPKLLTRPYTDYLLVNKTPTHRDSTNLRSIGQQAVLAVTPFLDSQAGVSVSVYYRLVETTIFAIRPASCLNCRICCLNCQQ